MNLEHKEIFFCAFVQEKAAAQLSNIGVSTAVAEEEEFSVSRSEFSSGNDEQIRPEDPAHSPSRHHTDVAGSIHRLFRVNDSRLFELGKNDAIPAELNYKVDPFLKQYCRSGYNFIELAGPFFA